jgi:intracellular septation protein
MQFLYDFLPIIFFFVAYKISNIYIATFVAMILSLLQIIVYWFKHHQLEKMQCFTAVIILILGLMTLFSRNPLFIQWKPTIVDWGFSLMFLLSQLFSEKPILQHLMGKKISLPSTVWNRLNISWGIFFLVMGIVNLYVVYHYSTNTWVNFKLFGMLGCTVIFAVLQSIYLSRYINIQNKS